MRLNLLAHPVPLSPCHLVTLGELGQRVNRPAVAGLSQFRCPPERGRGSVRLTAIRQRLAEQKVPLSGLRAELHEPADRRQPVLWLTEEPGQRRPLAQYHLAERRA